jgi:hypothetical protein
MKLYEYISNIKQGLFCNQWFKWKGMKLYETGISKIKEVGKKAKKIREVGKKAKKNQGGGKNGQKNQGCGIS